MELTLPADFPFKSEVVVLDLETSGLSPLGHQIIEIGLARFEPAAGQPRSAEVQTRLVKLPPGKQLSPEVAELTGISEELLEADGVSLEEAISWLVATVGPTAYLVGHNILRFDWPFLNVAISRLREQLGLALDDGLLRWGRYIDTAAIYKARQGGFHRQDREKLQDYYLRVLNTRNPGLKYNLAHACQELGVPLDGLTLHRAAGDVQAVFRLFERLVVEKRPRTAGAGPDRISA